MVTPLDVVAAGAQTRRSRARCCASTCTTLGVGLAHRPRPYEITATGVRGRGRVRRARSSSRRRRGAGRRSGSPTTRCTASWSTTPASSRASYRIGDCVAPRISRTRSSTGTAWRARSTRPTRPRRCPARASGPRSRDAFPVARPDPRRRPPAAAAGRRRALRRVHRRRRLHGAVDSAPDPRAEPSADIVVLEADVCGGGASGRNGGFAMTMWSKFGSLKKLGPTAEAVWLAQQAAESVPAIGRFCDDNGIDAEYRRNGWCGRRPARRSSAPGTRRWRRSRRPASARRSSR